MDFSNRAKALSAERHRICKCGKARKEHSLRCRNKACGGHATISAVGYLECAFCGGEVEVLARDIFANEAFCFGFRGTDEFLTERSAKEAAALAEEHASR